MVVSKKPLKISFPSILELTDPFVRFTEELCTYLEFDQHVVDNIVLSVDEALVNAIRHGNQNDPTTVVNLEFHLLKKGLKIKIIDRGRGFSPDEVGDPLSEENILKKGGRGVFLMRSLMEKVEFKRLDPGMCVTLYIGYNYQPSM